MYSLANAYIYWVLTDSLMEQNKEDKKFNYVQQRMPLESQNNIKMSRVLCIDWLALVSIFKI